MLIKRTAVILFCFALLLFAGCQKKDTFSLNDIKSFEMNYGWRMLDIDGPKDISNIVKLLSSMKIESGGSVDTENSKNYIITTNSEKLGIVINDSAVIIGNTIYNGASQSQAIQRILNYYIYDYNLFRGAIEKSSSLKLTASDIKKSTVITENDKEKLINLFSSSDIKINDNLGNDIPVYPNYAFEFIINDKPMQIMIISNGSVIFNDPETGTKKFSTNNEIWEFITKILPYNNPTEFAPDQINYLFNASNLFIPNGDNKGEYAYKISGIIRCLQQGILEEKKNISELNAENITLSFIVNTKTVLVEVYEDGFFYNKHYYSKQNILEEIKNAIAAG